MGLLTSESRYVFSEQYADPTGRLLLSDREPFRFAERDDNIYVTVGEGTTWWDLAEALYWPISERACGLYWVLIDYQVPPVVDPTLQIRPGSEIIAPSPLVVTTEILARQPELFL